MKDIKMMGHGNEKFRQAIIDELIKRKGYFTKLDIVLIDEAIASALLDTESSSAHTQGDEPRAHTCYEGHCNNGVTYEVQEPRH